MVSWPQGAVIAPPPPFPDFFLCFWAFFKNFHIRLGKKGKVFSTASGALGVVPFSDIVVVVSNPIRR